MNTKIIPTAEEFLRKNIDYVLEKDCKEDVENAMKEFAKMHVEAALKEVLHKYEFINITPEKFNSMEYQPFVTSLEGDIFIVDHNSILNSYPLSNIK